MDSSIGSSSFVEEHSDQQIMTEQGVRMSEVKMAASLDSAARSSGQHDVTAEQPFKDVKLLRKSIHVRQTAIQNPMMMDAIRRTRLGMKSGEVKGKLKFSVPKSNILNLPPTPDDGSDGSRYVTAARVTLCRRFEALHPCRKEDDASYFDAVEKGTEVTLVTALPPGYDQGGWRCHAKTPSSADSGQAATECLYPNRPDDEACIKCNSPKPNLRPEFAYLRLLPIGMRRQRNEYVRIILESDKELERCNAAEQEAVGRIAAFERKSDPSKEQKVVDNLSPTSPSASDSESPEDGTDNESTDFIAEEDMLMMDVDIVQRGVWQRVDARTLLNMLPSRKSELNHRLSNARAELSIMIQCAFDLAIPHLQRVARSFLVRCRLDQIRESVREFARFSAAIEIQRIVRSRLAYREANRRRQIRDHLMATRLQSMARKSFAIKERKRLYRIYIEKLRNKSAIIIQSLYRCHTCKRRAQELAEERRRQLEEQEKARVASLEKDSAIIIQKHCRRVLDKAKCANRRIELGLHQRLLMYLERYIVDGCMFSFVKSINDDYIRYERTITHTIQREEKMAKTFVEHVTRARDGDHSLAWENYIQITQNGKKTMKDDSSSPKVLNHSIVKRTTAKDKKEMNRHQITKMIYGSPHRPRTASLKRSHARKNGSDNQVSKHDLSITTQRSIEGRSNITTPEETSLSPHEDNIEEDSNDAVLDSSYQLEAKRLANIDRIKDRLRGLYLRFDIPSGLDDTVSRFIIAVMLRYKFETPGESSIHGNFESSDILKKEHYQKCLVYAEPLIQCLHGKGIVFIRQLLPTAKMAHTLSDLGLTEEFLQLSISMLNVLCQISSGNYLNRRYMMSKSEHLLESQKKLKATLSKNSNVSDQQNFNLFSFLGECGAAGSDDYDDDDNPGGLWKPKTTIVGETQEEHRRQETNESTLYRNRRSWVIPYAAKKRQDLFAKHPALGPYRNGQLLDQHSSISHR